MILDKSFGQKLNKDFLISMTKNVVFIGWFFIANGDILCVFLVGFSLQYKTMETEAKVSICVLLISLMSRRNNVYLRLQHFSH